MAESHSEKVLMSESRNYLSSRITHKNHSETKQVIMNESLNHLFRKGKEVTCGQAW